MNFTLPKPKKTARRSDADLVQRIAGFRQWIGEDSKWALGYIRSWKTGGLLSNESLDDLTHNILDAIKADPKSFRAGLDRYRRLRDHPELAPVEEIIP